MIENEGRYNNYRIAVPTDYQNVFSHFYFAENKTYQTITKTLMPSYQTILIFNFGPPTVLYSTQNIEIEKCLVLGPIKKAFDYSLPPKSKILVANFKDDAFYRFFGMAAVAEYLPINPDDLLSENCFAALWVKLNNINEPNHQINYILDFCKPYLKHRNKIAEKITKFNIENLNAIKSVANQHSQSERNIQLNHKKYFGYTAKEMNRFQRFLKAIELIQSIATSNSKIDWFEIIIECGYYDHSQLIHDFKYYIKITPTKYLKFQQDICNPKAE